VPKFNICSKIYKEMSKNMDFLVIFWQFLKMANLHPDWRFRLGSETQDWTCQKCWNGYEKTRHGNARTNGAKISCLLGTKTVIFSGCRFVPKQDHALQDCAALFLFVPVLTLGTNRAWKSMNMCPILRNNYLFPPKRHEILTLSVRAFSCRALRVR